MITSSIKSGIKVKFDPASTFNSRFWAYTESPNKSKSVKVSVKFFIFDLAFEISTMTNIPFYLTVSFLPTNKELFKGTSSQKNCFTNFNLLFGKIRQGYERGLL
jgi:hypothetical protein